MALLDSIHGPDEVKALSAEELPILAQEIRDAIIQTTSLNGGHIGPNLGVVELTIALHRAFDFREDKITFDVSHQGYVHKLLTGRKGEAFSKLRKSGGYSGFLMREESPYDHYGAGHAGTALSAAVGMAAGRDLKGTDENVVCLMGDAALTCGITMEALNNVTAATKKLVIVLNDNEWSIDKNVGALATYLNKLITTPTYNRLHKDLKSFLGEMPGGESVLKWASKAKQGIKDLAVPSSSSIFEDYGIRYLGPIDGHDMEELEKYLEFAKCSEQPVLLHVITEKGKGCDFALENPEKFHGTGAFHTETGETKSKTPPPPPNYQKVFGQKLCEFAKGDPKVVGITAAMPSGTSLNILKNTVPKQYFDVGIAEEHAVLFAAGLATQGMKPVVAIYSTFLQRAYDPIIHDVCLQDLNVFFCMDRAGLSANDGPTHHGLFDLSYLRCVPRAVVMQPKDEDELVDMMQTGLEYHGPIFMRYPRGPGEGVTIKHEAVALEIGKAEVLREGSDVAIWALGPMVGEAVKIAEDLQAQGISVSVTNARFVKPLDEALLKEQAAGHKLVVSMEDAVAIGGMGSAVTEVIKREEIGTPVEVIGWPDEFIEHGSSNEILREAHGLGTEQMRERILEAVNKVAEEVKT